MTVKQQLTRNQTLVLDKLGRAEGPLSAYALLDRLRDDGFRAPLQVYRALDRLIQAGLVHRLESLNAFVTCAGPHCHDRGITAFAICERCGSVSEFADELVSERLESRVGQTGFRTSRAMIEFRGTCAECVAGSA